MSARQIAAKVGVSPTTLTHLKRGQISVATETLRRLALVLGKPADVLYAAAGRIPPDIELIARNPSFWQAIRAMEKKGEEKK